MGRSWNDAIWRHAGCQKIIQEIFCMARSIHFISQKNICHVSKETSKSFSLAIHIAFNSKRHFVEIFGMDLFRKNLRRKNVWKGLIPKSIS